MQIIGVSNIKGGVGKTTTAVNLAFLGAAEGWTDLAILPLFSMVDRRRSLHEQVIAEARSRFPLILESEVPYWSEGNRLDRAMDSHAHPRRLAPVRAAIS